LELTYALFLGALSGLASALAHTSLWSAIARASPKKSAPWITAVGQNAAGVIVHSLAGIALGLAFWLSWGYAGLFPTSWWVRGIAFGALSWAACSLPILLTQAAARELSMRRVLVIAAQWATTCVLTGLACSWSWSKIP
jgi:hypothetical protein